MVSPPLPIIAPEATAGTRILRLTAGPAILAALTLAPPFKTKKKKNIVKFQNAYD